MTNSCLLPGADHPAVLVLGASGAGRTSVVEALGDLLNLATVESEELAALTPAGGRDAMVVDPQDAHERLHRAAVSVIRQGGEGAGSVASLSPSAVLDPQVADLVRQAQQAGTKVVALEADMNTLARRVGLGVARPTSLGPMRALFRTQLEQLHQAYEPLAELWCDTSNQSAVQTANEIAQQLGLDLS